MYLIIISFYIQYPGNPGEPGKLIAPPPHSLAGDKMGESPPEAAAALAAYIFASSWALVMFFLYLIRLLPNQLFTYL